MHWYMQLAGCVSFAHGRFNHWNCLADFAGASANYIYYWHVKEHLSTIGKSPALDTMARARLVADEGGIQPYVLWLGAALHLFMVGLILAAVGQGPTGGELGDPGDQNPVQSFFRTG